MNASSPQFFVGIDLGTTHTVVAFAPFGDTDCPPELFSIPQLIAPGEVAERALLPSVRYHPAEGEVSDSARFLPSDERSIIGEAARFLGSKSQGRLVTSAKSWLSHSGIDPNADILPWGGDECVSKVSPIDASASYLRHVVLVWGQRFPNAPLAEQRVVITVPASFDESSRALTLEAAKRAGLPAVRLLEEPQAVCYDWLRRHQGQISQQLQDRHLLLVCDVGGGTTDLTLIRIEHGGSEPTLTRIAVGEHLMLGGDNIDWALAHVAERRLREQEHKLSASAMAQLLEQCRVAKEQLLADSAANQATVTLLGGGSRLIASARSAHLTRDEVAEIALDGFLPVSELDQLPDKKRSGVVALGLPYAADPAISKHIAAFLHQHRTVAQQASANGSMVPDVLLLNGGLFRSPRLQQRIQDVFAHWSNTPPLLLDNPHPELAVAFGAVCFAQARQSKRKAIGGGASRSYFLLVEGSQDQQKGVCLLPKGSEEGHEVWLQRSMLLKVGQPVRFHLFSYNGDLAFSAGELVDLNDEFNELPPLAVALSGEAMQEIAVSLVTRYTELGTLQLQCVAAQDGNQRWDVEFQLRKSSLIENAELPKQLPAAYALIQAVFGAKSKQIDTSAVKTLRNDLEKCLGQSRAEWPLPLLRAIWQCLMDGAKYRRRSDAHERLWLSLIGFCLRPGVGDALDDWRVSQVWKFYAEGLQFVNEKQNWAEWWTLWRRIAGGLSADAQQQVLDDIRKYVNPSSARQPAVVKQLSVRSYEDIVRLAGALERIPITDKVQLADWLLQRLQKSSEPPNSWWALGRLGARILYHGHQQQVVPPDQAAEWVSQALGADWKKYPQAGWAATLMARPCDDRARDVADELRNRVSEKLKQSKAPQAWIDLVTEYKPLTEQQSQLIYGEALPPGLRLL